MASPGQGPGTPGPAPRILLQLAAPAQPQGHATVLRIEHLKAEPLPPLSFEVADGECLAVEAPSGAGKTRLLRAIADLDPATGQIFLDGAERNEMTAIEWRKSVRFVSAELGWWGETPATSFPKSHVENPRLVRLLASIGLDPACLGTDLSRLSSGERQRLTLVRALAGDPKVLLLDEPTSALDAASSALVEDLITVQLLAGRIVILATHDLALSVRLSHNRLLLPKARTPAALVEVRA